MTVAVKTKATNRKSNMLKRLKPMKLSGFVQQVDTNLYNFPNSDLVLQTGINDRVDHTEQTEEKSILAQFCTNHCQ